MGLKKMPRQTAQFTVQKLKEIFTKFYSKQARYVLLKILVLLKGNGELSGIKL